MDWIKTNRAHYFSKFDHIESTLSPFIFRDKGLWTL